MTEQDPVPKCTPYGLAVAALQECSALPACIVIHPDHVIWPFNSDQLNPETFQLLEPAGAVLSAFRAKQIPTVLVVPISQQQALQQCLDTANLATQFAAVVHFLDSEQQQQYTQQQQKPEQQQQQRQPPQPGALRNCLLQAANSIKAKIGAPWQQMLLFSADLLVVREASRLGMAAGRVTAATGLGVAELKAGLETYSSKLESDRGY